MKAKFFRNAFTKCIFFFVSFSIYFFNCSKIDIDKSGPSDFERLGLNARSSNCSSGYANLDTFIVDVKEMVLTLDSQTMYCACDSISQLNFFSWLSINGSIIRDTNFNHTPLMVNFDTINFYTCVNQTITQRLAKTKMLVNNLFYFGAISSTNRSLLLQFLDSLVLSPENVDYCNIIDQMQGDSIEQMIVKLPILSIVAAATVITETEVFGNQVLPIINHLLGGAAGAWAGAMIAIWDAVEEHGESGLYRDDTRLGKKMAQGFFSGFVTSI